MTQIPKEYQCIQIDYIEQPDHVNMIDTGITETSIVICTNTVAYQEDSKHPVLLSCEYEMNSVTRGRGRGGRGGRGMARGMARGRGERNDKFMSSLSSSPLPSTLPSSPTSIITDHPLTNRTDNMTTRDAECVLCMENQPEAVFVPCGHLCICHDCCQKEVLFECPICRAN